ncbi:MAG: tripartite tricarboxylate transporter substrate binding protein [Xanthomonadales bacterium]|nr:tripartite tricarboxylate transporter substrate binding protein [Xanthomonadales bacterium]
MKLLKRPVAAGLIVASLCTWAHAQEYPYKPVRWIVPFAPGGGPDVVARIVGNELGKILGQRIIIDNRTGAAGNLGSGIAAKSPPDGYTFLLGVASPLAINVSLYGSKLPYNPAEDFAPVSMILKVPQVLLLHPSVPTRDLTQLIALAKAYPKKLNYGSAGSGTSGHLVVALFTMAAGIQITHIPFRSSGLSSIAGLSGEVDMVVGSAASFMTYIKSGRLRPIAVSSAKRSPAIPDVPTMMESGLPGFDVSSWYCMVAPAGTPRPIVDKVHTALIRVLQAPEVHQLLLNEGAAPEPSTPEELGAFIRAEIVKWAAAVKASGAKVD